MFWTNFGRKVCIVLSYYLDQHFWAKFGPFCYEPDLVYFTTTRCGLFDYELDLVHFTTTRCHYEPDLVYFTTTRCHYEPDLVYFTTTRCGLLQYTYSLTIIFRCIQDIHTHKFSISILQGGRVNHPSPLVPLCLSFCNWCNRCL